ncbi:uncharacterized protein LOC124935426 [Impatiens glandulifera]|uniref:uncharacterized protein LOC124935426 n=1 Tax=Impatiens glandulifera TaxID=253017 RepID=UPI001FB051EE|nr:uncharacterized protein LOC124935426 [Impatiens glandulifera]
MAEEIGVSVLGKIAELLLIEPIQRELGYLFCFSSNFQELETQLTQLKATSNDVQGRQDAKKYEGKTLGDSVQLWIGDAKGKIEEAESLIKEKAEVQKGCFSIKWCSNISLRFSLGRKGKKLSLLLVELLRRGGELPSEGYDLPVQPRSCWRKYNSDDLDFESRTKIKEDIVEKLLDEETMLVGICGMGGVGKTTLAKQVLQELEIPCVEVLSMKSIPNIKTLCNILLPSLQKLKIDSCDDFQYVDFFDSLVISHLRNLIIKNCTKLKGVVGVTTGAEEQQRKSIEFPNLSTLELESLVELASFVIDVSNLGDKEEKSQSALFYQDDYQVSFPCLEDLQIKKLSKINYIIGRKREQLRGHHDHDDIEEGHGRKIQQPILLLFPNLKRLELYDLEELLSFVGVMNNNMDNNCKNQNALFHLDDDEVWFPCLDELVIEGLSKINYIVGWKEGEGHHHHKTFPVLHRLELHRLSNLIHVYEINEQPGLGGVLLFQNMTDLRVGGCGKLRYLFSENIGRVAVENLRWIHINDCGMMEVVMKNIEDDRTERGSNNSVDGNSRHFFPLLRRLLLWNLSGLRSFSDVAYTWELPSLYCIEVFRCPKLEALSPGYLDSPMLKKFEYDDRNVYNTWKGDVNDALRHLFLSRYSLPLSLSFIKRKENGEDEYEEYLEKRKRMKMMKRD